MTEEGEVFVTTVYDLTLANYGVNRGLGGQEQKTSMMMYHLHLHGRENNRSETRANHSNRS